MLSELKACLLFVFVLGRSNLASGRKRVVRRKAKYMDSLECACKVHARLLEKKERNRTFHTDNRICLSVYPLIL